jgi:hypothetical protein
MSGPSIRIFDDATALPDIEIARDIGQTIDIGSVDALDMGLLVNQKKITSPPRSPIGGNGGGIGGDDIEFVNLEDVGKPSVSFDIKPNVPSMSLNPDPIRIVRDSSSMPPAKPFSAPPPPKSSWFSSAETQAPAQAQAPATAESGSSGFMGGFRSWFNKGASNSDAQQQQQSLESSARVQEYLTPEQEFTKKTEALTLLERMDRKGITGNKMTIANTLEEIQAEVERRKDSKALEASLRFQRSMLTTVTNGLEFLNSRFDPLGVKLDGWSEQVSENIEDYDEIFEELYDKYKDKSKVAPEVRLVMSLGLSAAMCHVTNSMFKSRMPGMDDILRNNPGLAQQFAQAAAAQAVGPGFANFVGMGMSNNSPRRGSNAMPPPPPQPNGMFGSMMGEPIPQPPPTARREMRGPAGVEDILRTLNQAGESLPERMVPPPASPSLEAMDDVQSIRSGFTTETARAAGRSRRRPTQPVGATLTLNV